MSDNIYITEEEVTVVTVYEGPVGPQGKAFAPDAVGNTEQRSLYGNNAAMFSFLDTDADLLYFLTGNGVWSDPVSFGVGPTGNDGLSAYDVWLGQGHTGNEVQFLQALVGEQGPPGNDGHTPVFNWSGTYLTIDGTLGPDLKGEQGPPGLDGNGSGDMTKSVYDPGNHGYVDMAAFATWAGGIEWNDVANSPGMANGDNFGFMTAAEWTKLNGISSGADVTGTAITGVTGKTAPVDADTIPLINSESSNALSKITWANIKAALKSYFDSAYAALTHSHSGTYEPANANIQSHISSTSNPHSVTAGQVGAVATTLYDANTILIATTDNTPAALTVGASTIVGRKATGDIVALTKAEAQVVLNVADGATANAAASTAETTTGTDTAKFVTAAGLAAHEKTVDPTITTTASNTGTITFLLSWLSKIVKAITGKTNWYDTPDVSLATLKGQKVLFALTVYPNFDLTSATVALPYAMTVDTITIAGRTASNATKAPSSSTNAVLYKDGSSLDTRAFTVADTSFSSLSVSLAAGLYDLRLNQVAGYTGATDKVSVTFSGVRA